MAMQHDPVTGLHLPEDAMMRSWRCKRGHVRLANKPFVLDMLIDGEPVMRTDSLCAVCFKEFLEHRFRAPMVGEGPKKRQQTPARVRVVREK